MSAENGTCTNNRKRNDDVTCCEGTTIVILILVGSGIAALGVWALLWFFQDIFVAPEIVTPEIVTTIPFTSTTTTTQMPTTTTTTSIPTTTKPPSCKKRIVGFFNETDTREIETRQLSKLTHAVFAHLVITWEGDLEIESKQTGEDRLKGLVTAARGVATDLKVMASIVGSKTDFFNISKKTSYRKNFASSVIKKLEYYGIDGVDLQWEKETFSDNHLKLLGELRQRLNEKGRSYIISITIPAPPISESNFNLTGILKHADFLNIVSMKYHDLEGTRTAPISPLYSNSGNKLNVDATMDSFVCKTKEPLKFNIVIPFFVRLWNNVEMDSEKNHYFRYSPEKFEEVPRDSVTENASWDEASKSSFVYDESKSTFLSFEDVKSIEAKVDYVNRMNLGGVWIWMVEMDENRRLLNAVKNDEFFCRDGSEDIIKFKCD